MRVITARGSDFPGGISPTGPSVGKIFSRTKGIFITTSSFTDEALSYASSLGMKVVLLGGLELANLMMEHGVGVTTETVYKIKRIDSDYFDLA